MLVHEEDSSLIEYDALGEAEHAYFGRQLRTIRKKAHMSLDAMTKDLCGFNVHIQRSTISRWENGLTAPNVYQFFAICRLFDLEDGVRFFSGPLHEDEDALNEEGLKKLVAYRQDLIASGEYGATVDKEEISMRLYSFSGGTSSKSFLEGDDYEIVDFRASTVPSKADLALRVDGDSMLPNYQDGQIVWIQRCQALHSGEIGIFLVNGEPLMRVYIRSASPEDDIAGYAAPDDITLISLNKAYAPRVILPEDQFRILGRVLTK